MIKMYCEDESFLEGKRELLPSSEKQARDPGMKTALG